MYLTYHDKTCAESRDRVWLCRLLAVFALGETYITTPTPEIYLSPDLSQEACLDHRDMAKTTTTPGTEFFEQALMLLKIPFEEPTIEHIEALNLIVSTTFIPHLLSIVKNKTKLNVLPFIRLSTHTR
jgi:proline utilization trans-activator